jgi:hypothetical protein
MEAIQKQVKDIVIALRSTIQRMQKGQSCNVHDIVLVKGSNEQLGTYPSQ